METKFHDDHNARVRQRAHEIFLKRGHHHGDADSDWHQAEEEICAEEHGHHAHRGPAKMKDQSKWGHLAEHTGHDVENPT